MKLYLYNGTYLGTQGETKAALKEDGLPQSTADEYMVEVPTDKPGLIAYLNGLSVDRGGDEFETVVARNDPPVPNAVPVSAQAFGHTLTEVETFIQAAGPIELGRVADNVGQRFRELAVECAAFEHTGYAESVIPGSDTDSAITGMADDELDPLS